MESTLPLLFITKCERPQLCGNVDGWTVSMADFGPLDVIYAFKHVEMLLEASVRPENSLNLHSPRCRNGVQEFFEAFGLAEFAVERGMDARI